MDNYIEQIGVFNPSENSGRVLGNALTQSRVFGVDDFYTSWLGQLLYPGLQQQVEFGQQIALQNWQNDYNSPVNQMQRMVEAGINPNLAAQGIAGGSPAASQAQVGSSSVGSGEAAADALVGASSAAAGLGSMIQGFRKLPFEQALLHAQGVKSLEEAGLSHWQALSSMVLLPTLSPNAMADYFLKVSNIRNVMAEYDNIKAEHLRIMEEIELMETQEGINNQLKLKEAEITRWQQQENSFFESFGFRRGDPLDSGLRDAVVTGHLGVAEKAAEVIERYSYQNEAGRATAERKFGSSKSPWEMGDKYLKRLTDFIKGDEDIESRNNQIIDLIDKYLIDNPIKSEADAIKSLYSLGFSSDEVQSALEWWNKKTQTQ